MFKVYGQEGSPWQMLEGVLSSAPDRTGSGASHIDFNAIDGTRVQTVGSNAEMPRRGLLVDAVMKSGGNDFHGTAVVYGSGRALEGDNIDDTLEAAGIRLASCTPCRTSPAPWAAGSSGTSSGFSAAPGIRTVSRDILDAYDPDGTPIRMSRMARITLEKSRIRCRPGIASPASTTGTMICELRDASKFIPRESMVDKDDPVWMTKGEWQTVRGNALVASVQVGAWDFSGD